jgi:hypothetical protein
MHRALRQLHVDDKRRVTMAEGKGAALAKSKPPRETVSGGERQGVRATASLTASVRRSSRSKQAAVGHAMFKEKTQRLIEVSDNNNKKKAYDSDVIL